METRHRAESRFERTSPARSLPPATFVLGPMERDLPPRLVTSSSVRCQA
jgi:hypothetical protein